MGGNAIKSAERLTKEKFLQTTKELKELFPELTMEVVRFYRQKEDFGDIDIVVLKNKQIDVKKLVKDRINPKEIYDNNMFFSFAYKNAQIDFIFMSEENYQCALDYFAWNDLGNFIGRISRSLNFKYGHDGLFYTLRLDDHYKNDICVSKDTKKILEFLGYDANVWEAGFDTIDEIFEFALNTPFFNSTYFELEEQAHNDRVRNRKRKMYQKFLAYINAKGIVAKPKLTSEERLFHYERAIEFFGDTFHKTALEEIRKYDENVLFKSYFNGDVVNKLTNLEGKELGKFMADIKLNNPNLKEIVLYTDSDKRQLLVNDIILDHFKKLEVNV